MWMRDVRLCGQLLGCSSTPGTHTLATLSSRQLSRLQSWAAAVGARANRLAAMKATHDLSTGGICGVVAAAAQDAVSSCRGGRQQVVLTRMLAVLARTCR